MGEKRRQHVDEELHHQEERHALGDDELGETVDPVDDEEEGEEAGPEREGGEELPEEVAVDDADHPAASPTVVP